MASGCSSGTSGHSRLTSVLFLSFLFKPFLGVPYPFFKGFFSGSLSFVKGCFKGNYRAVSVPIRFVEVFLEVSILFKDFLKKDIGPMSFLKNKEQNCLY